MIKRRTMLSIMIVSFILLALPVAAFAQLEQEITVYGTGNVTLQPDLVTIEMAFSTQNDSIQEAISENAKSVKNVKSALIKLGIDEKDIVTSNYSVYNSPKTDGDGRRIENEFLFNVNYAMKIILRDTTRLNETLDTAFNNGVNNLYNITFDSTQRADASVKARELAIADARADAEIIAENLGVRILGVKTFNIRDYPLLSNTDMFKLGSDAGSAPINSGDLVVSITVDIVYHVSEK